MTARKYPRHDFWGAGEPDCPADLKASNGELHTMRCKVCGDGWRDSVDVCMARLGEHTHAEYADGFDDGKAQAFKEAVMLALQWSAAREPEYGGKALSNFADELKRRATDGVQTASPLSFKDGYENLCCYLIDKCEGETITEESLHRWVAAFLKEPRYSAATHGVRAADAAYREGYRRGYQHGALCERAEHRVGHNPFENGYCDGYADGKTAYGVEARRDSLPAKDVLPPKCAGCERRCSGCPMSHPDSTLGVKGTDHG